MSKTETKIRITDVRTVGVAVTKQDRALEFYVDRLGFEKRLDVPHGPGGALDRGGAPGGNDIDRAHSSARWRAGRGRDRRAVHDRGRRR